jgi:hypothetical protein
VIPEQRVLHRVHPLIRQSRLRIGEPAAVVAVVPLLQIAGIVSLSAALARRPPHAVTFASKEATVEGELRVAIIAPAGRSRTLTQ